MIITIMVTPILIYMHICIYHLYHLNDYRDHWYMMVKIMPMVIEYVWSKSNRSRCYIPVGISLPAKVLQALYSWRVCQSKQGRDISDETRGEREARIRVFRLLATPVRFGRNERGGGGGTFGTTGPPTLLVTPLTPTSPSVGSSAALLSVGRAFPRTSRRRFPRARLLLTHIPLRPSFGSFSFFFLRRVCIYERGYSQWMLSIDSTFVKSRSIFSYLYLLINLISK